MTATHALLILIGFVAFSTIGEHQFDADFFDRYYIALSRVRVWDGNLFSLLAATFLHTDMIMLAFNGLWLFVLGMPLERKIGPPALLLLVVVTSVVAHSWDLGYGVWLVLGAAAPVYGLLGFTLAGWQARPDLIPAPRKGSRRILLIFMPISMLFGALGWWHFGLLSPLVGFLMGGALAWAILSRGRLRMIGLAVCAVLLAGAAAAWTGPPLRWEAHLYRTLMAARGGEAALVDRHLAALASSRNLAAWNAAAWVRATSPIDGLRRPAEAVQLANRACDADQHKNPETLDTLAVAQAEAGDWTSAETTLQRALTLVTSDPRLEASELDGLLRGHLASIRSRRPIRDYGLFGLDPPPPPRLLESTSPYPATAR